MISTLVSAAVAVFSPIVVTNQAIDLGLKNDPAAIRTLNPDKVASREATAFVDFLSKAQTLSSREGWKIERNSKIGLYIGSKRLPDKEVSGVPVTVTITFSSNKETVRSVQFWLNYQKQSGKLSLVDVTTLE